MRGIETGKVRIRHEVFTEIARLAYEGGDYAKRLEELPFKIIPGEIGTYRDSLFLERAVVGERLRLAMGLPLRKFSEFSLLSWKKRLIRRSTTKSRSSTSSNSPATNAPTTS